MATRVLVTDGGDGGGRSALASVRALALAGLRPVVTVSGTRSIAASSRFCSGSVRVPRAEQPGYAGAVAAERERGGYLTVLVCSDAALRALDDPAARLLDKAGLAEAAVRAGLRTPHTEAFGSPGEAVAAAGRIAYPAVVKSADRPVRRVAGPAELASEARRRAGGIVVQEWVSDPLRSMSGVVAGGRLLASCHQRYLRTWPADCGTASAAETTDPDEGLEAGALAVLGSYEGIFQVQLAGPLLLDVNPRPYGSMPLAVAAGVNLPAIWCAHLAGVALAGEVRRSGEVRRARPGVFYRWFEGDVRNLFGGWRSGTPAVEVLRALAPRRGAAHSTERLSDPVPALVRLRMALQKR